jgi:hypothetical protein
MYWKKTYTELTEAYHSVPVRIEPVQKRFHLVKLKIAIYGPMIAPYVMLLMWANPLLAQVGGGWALEIETFLGTVK